MNIIRYFATAAYNDDDDKTPPSTTTTYNNNNGGWDTPNSNGENNRPMPPTLEASQSIHGSIYHDEFGAADYEYDYDFHNMQEDQPKEPMLMLTSPLDEDDVYPDQSADWDQRGLPANNEQQRQKKKSLPVALFSDEDDNDPPEVMVVSDDDLSPKSLSASLPPQRPSSSSSSTLFPDLDVGQQEPMIVPPPPMRSRMMPIAASLNLGTAPSPPAEIQQQTLGGRRDEKDLYSKGYNDGNAITTDVEALQAKLESLKQSIYVENKGGGFNINSNKQLSKALFGHPDESTDKDSLYAIASAGNKMADLILQYRKAKADLRRIEKKIETKENGVYVRSALISHANEDGSVRRDPLLLVDASAYIFRAYYSMPPFHRADGTPVGAVLGFCNMLNRLVLNRLLEGETPRLVLVFDPIGKNFRHDLYPEYKANRKECPIDLKPQFALIREAAKAYGIHELEAEGYEADDVIATLVTMAMKENVDCHILSGDKDLMQLITPHERTESYVHVIDPMSMARVDYTAVVEKWGVGPQLVGDLLAIMGDSSDNIPGIKGLGPKTGASLLMQFKSLDAILDDPSLIEKKAQRTKIEQNIEIARLSRQLVDLVRDIPREKMIFPEHCLSVADLRMEGLETERLLKFYRNMGFKDLARRLEGRLSSKPVLSKKKKSSWKGRESTTIPKPEDFDDVPF